MLSRLSPLDDFTRGRIVDDIADDVARKVADRMPMRPVFNGRTPQVLVTIILALATWGLTVTAAYYGAKERLALAESQLIALTATVNEMQKDVKGLVVSVTSLQAQQGR